MASPDTLAAQTERAIASLHPAPVHADSGPGTARHAENGRAQLAPGEAAELRTLFRAQATSRHVDLAARWMQTQGRGYYTISSAGHESNAVVAAASRCTDPALLHYRSGAFYVRRAWQYNEQHSPAVAPLDGSPAGDGRAGYQPDHRPEAIDPVADILAGVAADANEPIAGGRHKVFGRHEIAVIPQTSTIASHLPRAVGVAFAIDRAKKLAAPAAWPLDAITIASLGDASANHSTATGAINSAIWSHYAGLPMPLLIVCEDNGLGISVRTPRGWIQNTYGTRPGLRYFTADGDDPLGALQAARDAADYVRRQRAPAFLHLHTVRFYGHAGSDVEAAYRTPNDMEQDRLRDPLIAAARTLVRFGAASADDLAAEFAQIGREVSERAHAALHATGLQTRAEVIAPLAPRTPGAVARAVFGATDAAARDRASGHDTAAPAAAPAPAPAAAPETFTVAQAINHTLRDELARRPEMILFGEDVARKGGVYGVTRGLQQAAGAARVFDTPLDEQTVLGLALGSAVTGLLPVPEIQYLAYLHNAEDQLRGEAATLQFFSRGAYRNGMVVRIASYGYQKGFGGHFHNDNSVAVLRDMPGVVIASPSRADDAAAMLRTCIAAASIDGAVCAFLEPIALYHTRDLHEEGDNAWLAPMPRAHVPIGSARSYRLPDDGRPDRVTILTFGNGVPLSLRAAAQLAADRHGEVYDGIRCRVVDLRWLSPLPVEDMLREANTTGRVLIVDETRRTGGVGEGIASELLDAGFAGHIDRVAAADSFVPLGPAANLVLVSDTEVIHAARTLAHR